MNTQTYPIVSKSIRGRFFTDESCIYCALCVDTAPANFAYDDSVGSAYVFKQPSTDEEICGVIEALEGCPTESIGDREHYKSNHHSAKMNMRQLLTRNQWLAIAVVIVACFIAVVCCMDPFILMMLGILVVWIGIPALLVAGILWLIAFHCGHSNRAALTILSIVAAFGCFVGLAIPPNRFVQQRAVEAAKEYPSRVAQLLEAYRSSHGAYPTNLAQLPSMPSLPRLLRSSYGYRSDGSSYSFSFSQPGGLIDTWEYSSETKTWYLST